MIRATVPAALLALAACGDGSPPPPPTPGQQARVKVNAATKLFADCVLNSARTQPVDSAVGPLAQRALEACPDERAALKREVVSFTRVGRPTLNDYQAGLLSEASVKQLESGLREQAAIATVNRSDVTPKG